MKKQVILFSLFMVILVASFLLNLLLGTVHIPFDSICDILMGNPTDKTLPLHY